MLSPIGYHSRGGAGQSPAALDKGPFSGYSFERTFDQVLRAVPRNPLPNHRHSERKLQHILRHAAQVFSERGYEGASIRAISRSSGVSLSGLYYYFESKQELLYLIQSYTFTEILRRLEKRLRAVRDPAERLHVLVENHLDYFLRNPVEMKVLSHEDEALEPPYRKEIADIKRRYYALARGIFEELRQSGRVRRINPRIAVLSLFGMMNWVYTWHHPKLDPGAESLAETMAGIFLQGVSQDGHSAARQKAGRAGSRPVAAARLAGVSPG